LIELSIVIPSREEPEVIEKYLPDILNRIQDSSRSELIFVNANPNPNLERLINKYPSLSYCFSPLARRSSQMNLGASRASGNYFLFLHLDSLPPQNFDALVISSLKSGSESGCFQLRFDLDHWLLNFSSWFTRFPSPFYRGGDQGLFVERSLFESIGGFREDYVVFEDIDICRKLLKRKTFEVLSSHVVTSARKYRKNGVVRLQFYFTILSIFYWLGVKNHQLVVLYKKLIK
jgi:rSAM/selenodomain-associated transferase 2